MMLRVRGLPASVGSLPVTKLPGYKSSYHTKNEESLNEYGVVDMSAYAERRAQTADMILVTYELRVQVRRITYES